MSGARVIRAERGQVCWDRVDLDSQLPPEHRARIVWLFVEQLDLSEFYALVRSRAGGPGAPAADPRVLLGLWLYATLDGVGSARDLAQLTLEHSADRWLRGGVPLDRNVLAKFRVSHAERLDRLMTQSLAACLSEGLVTCEDLAIDGTKIRAAAHRSRVADADALATREAAVAARLATLRAGLEGDGSATGRTRQARADARAQAVADQLARARAKLGAVQAEAAQTAEHHKQAEAAKAARARRCCAKVREDAKPESVRRRRAKEAKEPDCVRAWRADLKTDEGKALDRRRLEVERAHAQMKRRGLARLPVRGLARVLSVRLLHALAHTLWHAHRLRTARA